MKNPYYEEKSTTLYAEEQLAFAEMKEALQERKRRQRRRRVVMWLLRRL